tara:strand:- start:73 stop:249 length:177 start_codon:yes stop_codon:yes gene_type:complete
MSKNKKQNPAEKFSDLFNDSSLKIFKESGMNNFFDNVSKNIESLIGPRNKKKDKDNLG